MAQSQLDDHEMCWTLAGFKALEWLPQYVVIHCAVDSEHTITLKREGKTTHVFINNGIGGVRLDMDTFNNICDLKESVSLLCSFLELQERSKDE